MQQARTFRYNGINLLVLGPLGSVNIFWADLMAIVIVAASLHDFFEIVFQTTRTSSSLRILTAMISGPSGLRRGNGCTSDNSSTLEFIILLNSLANEYDIPSNVLLCGRAAGRHI
uniref:Uncharacterized protein n=1 Tax=Helianthus annuus TaxID=4232 RepID=A0A251TKL5_HELAN